MSKLATWSLVGVGLLGCATIAVVTATRPAPASADVDASGSQPVSVQTAAPITQPATVPVPAVHTAALHDSAAPSPVQPFVLDCAGAASLPSAARAEQRTGVREAAQRSLDFLVRETIAWQNQYNCMGCHVQGVTGEALAVGFANQYDIGQQDMETVFAGNLDVDGGVRTSSGHAAVGGYLRLPSRTFGGAALARYDELVSDQYRDDLFTAAKDILEYQNTDGSLQNTYPRPPVSMGDAHQTYQAILTWKQAYARSADDRWLTAVAHGEAYLRRMVEGWKQTPPADLQDVDYAMLGLLAAGVGASEDDMLRLQELVVGAQNQDGGWGYGLEPGGPSTPLVTGQALYTLRRLGLNDGDPVVERGIAWLIETQQKNGGWSDSGAGKAEAMWAVLGLVATDVLSIDVRGVRNGQHVGHGISVEAHAADNGGAGVARVEVVLDDIKVFGECGEKAAWTLQAEGLEAGPHVLELVATSVEGKVATRRFVVYAGDTYLTQLGTKFEEGGTIVTLRDIAPTDLTHSVELVIRRADAATGLAVGEPIFSRSMSGTQGALSFFWDGSIGTTGEKAQRGDYYAEVVFRDADGKARQTAGLPFVHDTFEAQLANYGQVAGQLQFDDAQAAENAVVELVDEEGNIVQSVRSTSAGSYRFRNVKAAAGAKARKYKVRVQKKGFDAEEIEVAPAAGADSKVDLMLH